MSITNKDDVCTLLDKLTIDALDLIEQKVKTAINIEKVTNEGYLLIAKSRYIQGPQTVTVSQLPTENSTEFNALATVNDDKDEINNKKLNLEMHSVDKDNGYVDPIKWFGILVPHSLQLAKDKFKVSVDLSVESANTQIKLLNTCTNIFKLKKIKENL